MSPLRFLPLLSILLVPGVAAADLSGPVRVLDGVAYVQAGYEGSLETLTLGYAHQLEASSVDAPSSTYLEVRLETESIARSAAVESGIVRAGLRVELFRASRFALPIRGGLAIGVDVEPQTELLIAMRTEVAALPGYYGVQGSFALEVGLRSTWAEYRSSLAGDAAPGAWEHDSAQKVHLGVRAGVAISPRCSLALRVGYDDVRDLREVTPTYADLTAGVHF